MKLQILFSLVLIFISFHSEAKDSMKASKNLNYGSPVFYMSAGKMLYGVKENGDSPKPASLSVFNDTVDDLIQKAKDSACGMKIKPSSVEVSMGLVSMSWDTEKLCSGK